MPQKIESDKLFVKDAFQKWYRIPEYQRPYVWGSDQVLELLEDVYQARQSNPESQYFLGSMVLKKNEKQDGSTKYEEYDLLDGQQRLTTLFLITAVVRDLTPLSNGARLKNCRETIYQMANPDDNIPERLRIVFDIRDKVRDFVNDYIKADGGTAQVEELTRFSERSDEDISIRNMANALLTVRRYFENGCAVDDFFPYLRSNVLMIYVAADELEDAFHLFTVMNNRGIKLRNSDILKAENLQRIPDDSSRMKYARLWENIEEYYAEDFDNFLSHLRTILVKQKAGYNLLKEYEENVYAPREFDRNTKTYTSKPPLLTKGQNTFQFIEKYHKHYLTLFEEEHYDLTGSFEFYNQLVLMKVGLEADYWIAALLRYYDKYKNDHLVEFTRSLDNKFTADWIVGVSPTKRIENVNEIIKQIDASPNVADLLATDSFKIDEEDLKRVLTGSIYGRRYARYLLLKLDLGFHGHTTKFTPPETISIEHILPQNPGSGSQWISDFTDSDREKWTHRVGNLILLSRRKNTSQSNLDFALKREKYFKNNIELFSNSVRIFQQFQTWNLTDIQNNQKETLKKLLSLYSVAISQVELRDMVEESWQNTSNILPSSVCAN
jgi:uncharacterized protein with ParB-like and HNH nuclease domain